MHQNLHKRWFMHIVPAPDICLARLLPLVTHTANSYVHNICLDVGPTHAISIRPNCTMPLCSNWPTNRTYWIQLEFLQNRPSIHKCMQIVAQSIVACAQFFAAYVHALKTVMLGWSDTEQRQINCNCPFGTIRALLMKPETSGRGAMHLHCLLNQPHLQPGLIANWIKTANIKQQLLDFLESTCCQWMLSSEPVLQPTVDIHNILSSQFPLQPPNLCNCILCPHSLQ